MLLACIINNLLNFRSFHKKITFRRNIIITIVSYEDYFASVFVWVFNKKENKYKNKGYLNLIICII